MSTTFKAVVYADNRRKDGTYNVKIRLTHRRQTLKLSTNIYVATYQLTRSLKIKDAAVIDATDHIIREWRAIVGTLGMAADAMTAQQVVDYIKQTEQSQKVFSLDFIAYMRRIGASLSAGTGRNYAVTANALARYTGNKPFDIAQVTAKFLGDFEDFLRSEPSMRGSNGRYRGDETPKGDRAVSLYMGIIRATHNRAKQEYNDEDIGLIRIPRSPFAQYRIPAQAMPQKRAVDVAVWQKVIDVGDEGRSRYLLLARDCFLLSFGLIGMNAVDLYLCCAQDLAGGVIVYNRKKTATRRTDHAEMHVRIEPQIAPLVCKYADTSNERLFVFHKQYATADGFTRALNRGLKELSDVLGLASPVTFYAARHSWATIARSSALKIDKYTVHEALNHVDSGMKITDRYIDRDWSVVWEANAKVIGLFDWAELKKREENM